jgi:hypothetical protein
MRTKTLLLSTLFLLATSAVAQAEGPQEPPPPPPDGGQNGQNGQTGYDQQQQGNGQVMGQPGDQGQGQGQGNGQPVMQAPPPQTANQQAQQGRGIEYGVYGYVPVFIASTNPNLGAGIGVQGRIGWEFGSGFTAELQGGLSYNGLIGLNYGLTNLWIGVGARYSFLNDSPFVPFVGGGISLNFWGLTSYGNNDALAFGFNLLGGAAYEVSADFAIEAGLQFFGTSDATTGFTRIFGGDFAFGLAPFVGVSLYY